MAEATETATTQTEAATSPEAAAATLLGNTATETTTQQPPAATQEAPPEGIKPAAEGAKAAEGAPEKYEFKAPEGVEYDKNLLEAFEAGAKEANLPQEAAQKLLDQMAPKIAERQAEQVVAIRKEWFQQSQIDKEFGGEKLETNLGVAKQALDKFGSPELNKLLVSTGLGNHPEVIRFMFKAGKALGEDTFVSGSAPAKSQVDRTQVLYDKTS